MVSFEPGPLRHPVYNQIDFLILIWCEIGSNNEISQKDDKK